MRDLTPEASSGDAGEKEDAQEEEQLVHVCRSRLDCCRDCWADPRLELNNEKYS